MRKKIRKLLEEEVVSAADTGDLNVRHKIKAGTVEAVKVGGVWLLDREDLNKKNDPAP